MKPMRARLHLDPGHQAAPLRWEAELAAYFDAVEGDSAARSIDGTGVMRISFDATTYEWTNDYSLSIVISGVTYQAVLSGGFSGTYTEAAGVPTGSIDEEHRTGTITRDGKPLEEDVGDLFVGINPARPMDRLAYSCEGPTLILQEAPFVGAARPVALTPA